MGHLQLIRDFPSPPEGKRRWLRVWTPEGYDPHGAHRYPVLYMHDGQNVFAHPDSARFETWGANFTMEHLANEGRIENWIIVGIDHSPDRFSEYSPWNHTREHVTARAPLYADFLRNHLKPWIDRTYRTRPEAHWTATMGSSLGGLVSLYLGLEHGDVFGRVGALSPSVMWSDRKIFQKWRRHTGRWTRLYLDAGQNEVFHLPGYDMNYGPDTREFFVHLKNLGYDDHELCLVLDPGGLHSERDWARRLPFAFRWLLS